MSFTPHEDALRAAAKALLKVAWTRDDGSVSVPRYDLENLRRAVEAADRSAK